jgi:hypothetical protein
MQSVNKNSKVNGKVLKLVSQMNEAAKWTEYGYYAQPQAAHKAAFRPKVSRAIRNRGTQVND